MIYQSFLQQFKPDADALLIALSQHIDDDTLIRIAHNDWGQDVDEHLAELLLIRDEHTVLASMIWHPKEVLELERWGNPSTEMQHLSRAFACAALLRMIALPDNENHFDGDNQTIATLLDSLAVLDMSFQRAALRFFVWRAQDLSRRYDEAPFYILALLILILRTQTPLTHADLKALIGWIHAIVRDARSGHLMIMEYTGPQWLTWLTHFNQRHSLWQALGQEITARSVQYKNSEGGQNLRTLARHFRDT